MQADLKSAAAQAVLLSRAGQWTAAEALCRQLLAFEPAEPTALLVLGACQMQRDRFADAERTFAALLQAQPDHAAALANRGVALQELKRHEEALASFNRALAFEPNNVRLYWQRARSWRAIQRFEPELDDLDRAVFLLGEKRDLLLERADALRQIRRVTEALASIDRVLSWNAEDQRALDARAASLVELRRWEDARQAYENLIAVNPDDVDALASLAGVLSRLDRPAEALDACDQALAKQSNHVGALNNRCSALTLLGRLDEAMAAVNTAITLDGRNPDCRWNRARLHLMQGKFTEAWRDHEYRWQRSRFLQSLRSLPEPIWDGTARVEGKTVLLHAEQGLGDTIQYARYAAVLAARGARVILGAHRPLKPLLETIDGVSTVIAGGEEMPAFDLHCPLLSLPALFNTTLESIPVVVPYFRTDSTRRSRWAQRLGTKRRMRVGLTWAGNPTQEDDVRRSMHLRSLAPLLAAPAEFVCLSKVVRETDRDDMTRLGIRHFGDDLTDFAETAALAGQMDLVISVDTSVAHLAGALGRPLWVLLSYMPDSRWLLHREDCPWYPTARLFRQQARGDWDGVVERVARELEEFLAPSAT